MKKKIAVIGGGLGSVTAIYELMNLPNAKELYDITLYQDGWRLGGKGASGVNREKGFRVEEHGIHFWFGFYENGFRLMKEVYKNLDRPEKSPLATFEKAFKKQPFMDFAQNIDNKWSHWQIPFPDLPGELGDGKFLNPIEEVIEIGIHFLAEKIANIIHHIQSGCFGVLLKPFSKNKLPEHPTHEKYLTDFEIKIANKIAHPIEKRLYALAHLHKQSQHHSPKYIKAHAAYIHSFRLHIWHAIGHLVSKFPTVLEAWCILDFGLTVLKGVIEDGVLYKEGGKLHFDFSVINDFDYEEWLIYHGADKHFIKNTPAVKSMYDGPFAFFKGAISTPNVEAGTALNIFFRLAFSCKEQVMWRMQAGMGDTIFAPIYEYFKKNFPDNVHFKFFHAASDLKLSKDKTVVEEMIVYKQVELAKHVDEYNPLINVNGLNCWPSEPLYELLNPKQVKELKDRNIQLTSDWSDWDGGEEIPLKRGKDFDEIIIGASIAALPNFAAELINHNPRLAIMLDRVGTVQTQAFQLWLTKDPKELGVEESKVLSTYVEPLDTFAEMNQILEREDWSKYKEKPKYILYVCGALLDSETIPPPKATYFPVNQHYKVKGNMYEYILKSLQFVLPKAFDKHGNFDWNVLYDPTGAVGEDRLDYQYHRSNIDTSERYVFSLKGSSKYRLKTDETGFDNVFFTGDWIQNGLNIGFVEGASISGILTARAVSGNQDIPVYLPW